MRMRRMLIVVGLMAMMASVAGAQSVLPGPNALGLYFDGEAVGNNLTLGAPATVDVYLIFTKPTIAFINAWECKVTISAGATIVGVTLPVNSTEISTGPPDFSVEMSEPMPCNPLTKLAVFSVSSSADENIHLYLGNVDNGFAPGDLPAVRQPDGSWSSVPVSSGDPSEPVAGINSSTPNENTSWGSVKSLFR